MAKLKNHFIAIPAGKLGNVVFKSRKGVPYISLRPDKYRIRNTAYRRKVSENFLFAARFCSALNRNTLLKSLWQTPYETAYIQMMGCNLKKTRSGSAFENLSLVPVQGSFEPVVAGISMNNEFLDISFNAFGNKIGINDIWISLQGVLCLENPLDPENKPFCFLSLNSGDSIVLHNEPMLFRTKFSDNETDLIKGYGSRKILIDLITKDKNGNPQKFSMNIFREI